MNNNLFLIWLLLIVPLQDSYCGGNEPVPGNNKPQKRIDRSVVSGQIQQNSAVLDRFAAKCEKRTEKALRRMQRYEEKLAKSVISKQLSVNSDQLAVNSGQLTNGQENNNITPREGPGEASSTGREPLLDSLRLAYGFAQQAGLAQEAGQTGRVWKSIAGAQEQLDITNRTKAELHRQKEKWKAEAKNHPEYKKWVGKMEKEEYYYGAQVREYRKVLRDPSVLDDNLMSTLRADPRWSEYLAALPAKPQDQSKMQPKQLVQQMMQSQAAFIDPDAMKLISEAKKKGSDLLGELSQSATSIGNLDNATQVPRFRPNPYKTKSFWQRIDAGFGLQFDRRKFNLPASGTAGVQVSFNFSQHWSAGLLANYRFGMGEIKNIRFSHAGAGYGAFANYKVWKGLGVQAGFERNWREAVKSGENSHPATWTSSALAGLTWEYSIGKKAKGTVGVFFDALYKQHTPQTNAVLWRMGWKM